MEGVICLFFSFLLLSFKGEMDGIRIGWAKTDVRG